MIKYEEYFISNKDGKSNCVIRTFCKLFNKDYDTIFNELVDLTHELNRNSFNNDAIIMKGMTSAKVSLMRKSTGKKVNYKITERRPGDIATCYADPKKAKKELGWKAEKNLEDMCKDSWRYIENCK